MVDIIRFYRTAEAYGFLSNFYVGNPIITQGHVFRTSEHLYQALKFSHEPKVFAAIRDARSARLSAQLGRETKKMREDWETARVFAMRLALLLKFEDAEARLALLETGDALLVEDSPTDSFWGIGAGHGINMLGKLLGEARAFYRSLEGDAPHQELAEIGDLHTELLARLRTKTYPILFPRTDIEVKP